MLIRKVICCISLFAAMLILGWKMEKLLTPNTAVSQISSFSITDSLPISVPFLPREYVRIRQAID
jgi:hypothetical protein